MFKKLILGVAAACLIGLAVPATASANPYCGPRHHHSYGGYYGRQYYGGPRFYTQPNYGPRFYGPGLGGSGFYLNNNPYRGGVRGGLWIGF